MMTPGITGRCGKCPVKVRLVERHVLQRVNVLAGHAFQHAIHQQEGIPMRQLPHDRFDIQLLGFCHHRSFTSSRRRCATMRRHNRVSTVGIPLE